MIVAAMTVLCSCNSDNDLIVDANLDVSKEALVFTASMEGSETRVTLNSNTPTWQLGDEISINGKSYVAQSDGSTTSFAAVDEEASGENYKAFFPSSLYSGTLPATQIYEEGKFNMPMYAESNTTTLEFKNMCAVLAIKVTSEDISVLKSIKVSSDRAMYGTFRIQDYRAVIDDSYDAARDVVLECPTALTLSPEGATFYIAIPAQRYNYLNIYLSADGTTYKQAMATKKRDGLGRLERNKIFCIDYAPNAIQLWADGPMIATVNVGVTDGKPESHGGYYCWGKSVNQDESNQYYTGSGDLMGTDDTATALWGLTWRMPSKGEFISFCTNCDVTSETVNGIWGRRFEGKGDYAGSSLFLPIAGYSYNGHVESENYSYYWTSTAAPYHSYKAYYVDTNTNYWPPTAEEWARNYGFLVRAILDENLPEPMTGTAKATIGDGPVEVEWVRLWDKGPKFAVYNLGVTDGKIANYGGYYTWGGKVEASRTQQYNNEGTTDLTGDDDTATHIWGNEWRMPTKDEMQALIDNCDCDFQMKTRDGVKGVEYNGRGKYAGLSLFLPAGSTYYPVQDFVLNQGDYGFYRTSTIYRSEKAYSLYFNPGQHDIYGNPCFGLVDDTRYNGHNIRAVIND